MLALFYLFLSSESSIKFGSQRKKKKEMLNFERKEDVLHQILF